MRLRGGRPGPAAVTLVRTDSARDTPSLSRRAFVGAALAAPTAAWLVSCAESEPEEAGSAPQEGPLRSWSDVRAQFELDPGVNHLSAFILAPHSRPVRNAIATHRAGLDRDPHGYLLANQDRVRAVARAAAAYLERSGAPARFNTLNLDPATGAPDSQTARVVLTAVVHPPIVNFLVPAGIPIAATADARADLTR